MTSIELMEEAKRRFPKGTVFFNQNLIPSVIDKQVSSGEGFREGMHGQEITVRCRPLDARRGAIEGTYTIYRKGQWADIIEHPDPNFSLQNELYDIF